MKLSKILKYSSFICLIVFLIMVCSLIYKNYTSAQEADHELLGYMWSSNYGWISLSSKNCEQFETANCRYNEDTRIDYNVELNSDNTITGWAWSENVGWVCFGSTCSEDGDDAPSGGWRMNMSNTGEIEGWAKILSLGNNGWLKFNSDENRTKPNQDGPLGNECYNCYNECIEYCDLGNTNTNCQVPVCDVNNGDEEECKNICAEDQKKCENCFSQTFFDNGSPTSTHPYPSVIGVDCSVNPDECWTPEGNGYFCSDCSSCEKEELINGDFRITCDDCDGDCKYYGSIVNRIYEGGDGRLFGWAWNGNAEDGQGNSDGAGWVKFSAGSTVVNPWLQTKYGAIFTPKTVSQRSAEIGANATYCIFAENMVNISSSRCEELVTGVQIDFPSQVNEDEKVFRNILGKIDIKGLVTKVQEGRNKYGQIVEEIDELKDSSTGLNNKVYYAEDDLTVGRFAFLRGYGSGTIVVDGDLIIDGNIVYQDQANLPDELSQVPSVAWIVRGDIIIDNEDVDKIVGAFLALGDGQNECMKEGNSVYDGYQENSCGVFSSGPFDEQLTVLGLLIARAFNFERVFSDPLIGSEKVIYDGRLVANPPPGLQGFFEKLPIIRDFSY